MNSAFQRIVAASDRDRRDLFFATAARVGTTIQNIEKDFWVCWTLEALFHRLDANAPRLLFKGGTSLSKAYNLIRRFSEDIDVTVFRNDIGEGASFGDLEEISKKKRTSRLDAIKEACRTYIDKTLRVQLEGLGKKDLEAAGIDPEKFNVVLDPDDSDRQSLLIMYPGAVEKSEYLRPSIKLESGAKSALDPNEARTITPYLKADLNDADAMIVNDVRTIDPKRTFLDKVLILHGMTSYFEAKQALRGDGRMSRHYYDVYQLMSTPVGEGACRDGNLIEDCVRHARMFFYRNHTGLDVARPGQFRLRPTEGMLPQLRADYAAMNTMIFGDVPSFDDILGGVAQAEQELNQL